MLYLYALMSELDLDHIISDSCKESSLGA